MEGIKVEDIGFRYGKGHIDQEVLSISNKFKDYKNTKNRSHLLEILNSVYESSDKLLKDKMVDDEKEKKEVEDEIFHLVSKILEIEKCLFQEIERTLNKCSKCGFVKRWFSCFLG